MASSCCEGIFRYRRPEVFFCAAYDWWVSCLVSMSTSSLSSIIFTKFVISVGVVMSSLNCRLNPVVEWSSNFDGFLLLLHDSDFAETKDMGVQVISRGNKDDNANLNEADDKGNCNKCDLQSNEENGNSYSEENGTEGREMGTDVLDKDHDLIREVHIENMDQFVNNSLSLQPLYRDAADDESSLEIRDEYSEHDFSETDIDYSEDSSDDDFWQPQEDRRWVGVSPAKYRLLRKWFYD